MYVGPPPWFAKFKILRKQFWTLLRRPKFNFYLGVAFLINRVENSQIKTFLCFLFHLCSWMKLQLRRFYIWGHLVANICLQLNHRTQYCSDGSRWKTISSKIAFLNSFHMNKLSPLSPTSTLRTVLSSLQRFLPFQKQVCNYFRFNRAEANVQRRAKSTWNDEKKIKEGSTGKV